MPASRALGSLETGQPNWFTKPGMTRSGAHGVAAVRRRVGTGLCGLVWLILRVHYGSTQGPYEGSRKWSPL